MFQKGVHVDLAAHLRQSPMMYGMAVRAEALETYEPLQLFFLIELPHFMQVCVRYVPALFCSAELTSEVFSSADLFGKSLPFPRAHFFAEVLVKTCLRNQVQLELHRVLF